MKLLWNPDIDVRAEIADICQAFYGPAGEAMTAFNLRLFERFAMKWENAKPIWGQYYVHPEYYYGQSYPLPKSNILLDCWKLHALRWGFSTN